MTIKKGYLDTSQGQIHYRVSGHREGAPLLLLHQTASSSVMYEALMQQLDDTFYMLAPDTPGFGQSFFPNAQPSITDYVSTLVEALDQFNFPPAVVFGHHTGASIACELAATQPDRVRQLILSGPPYMEADDRHHWLEHAIKPMVIQADGSHLMGIWKRVNRHDPGPHPTLAHRETVENLRAGERWHEAYVAVFSQDFPALLRQVRCPTLMLCGKDDLLQPYFQPACAAFPAAQHAVLPGGTFVVDEYPEAVAAEIRSFVRPTT